MKNRLFRNRGIVRALCGLTALACLLMPGATALAEGLYRVDYVFDCRYEPKTGEGYAGYAVHVHNSDCFDAYYERRCDLPVIPPHVHSESCYDAGGNLICGQLELHTHTGDCYDGEGKLICGQPELEEHVHGPECFRRVIVEVDGETGNETIVSEPDTDLETAEDWEATLREVELTGDPRRDLVAVAKSQLGYTESKTNIAIGGEFHGGHYNRYGVWYGYPYGAWCAMFVSFCLYYAGIPDEAFPYDSGTVNWVDVLKHKGLFENALSHTPAPGDIVFFDWDNGRADHVGIVTEVEGSIMRTVEGNREPVVKEYEYDYVRDAGRIVGYGILPEEPEWDSLKSDEKKS